MEHFEGFSYIPGSPFLTDEELAAEVKKQMDNFKNSLDKVLETE